MVSTKQVNYIRKRSRQGASANQIQREMQARRMGMKRQRLLAYVREYKGQKPKSEPFKYIPTKYRRGRYALKGKGVAIYGIDRKGNSRRIQLYGDGQGLYRSVMIAVKYPPRQRFLTIGARQFLMNPRRYIDPLEHWSRKVDVESR